MATRSRDRDARRNVKTTGVHIRKTDPSTWSGRAQVELIDDALVVVTQAYCHQGHPLVQEDHPLFGGFPGLRLDVKAGGQVHAVYLSPIHGHDEKVGGESIPAGTVCGVACPVCHEELPEYAPCACGKGRLRAIHLSAEHKDAHVAAVCEVWGCARSRVIDEWEVLSEILEAEAALG
ncbi:MAG: hypothetical protein H6744_18315 [Deltaproteobacteria bacterium]|nr:hypothetical protein [Deltaproteobacteria bacterium]MCB9788635.1 hypothetical protein [Deltaproteobacteria bacterium]